MNAKTAKLLRKAAGYRNQAATPGTMPFPGVARFYQHPVYESREVQRSEGWLTSPLRRAILTAKRLVHAGDKPVRSWTKDPQSGKFVPEMQMVPVTRPARLNPSEAKGLYRTLKRLERTVGLQRLAHYLAGADDEEIGKLKGEIDRKIRSATSKAGARLAQQ